MVQPLGHPIDQRTGLLGLLLPHLENDQRDDVPRMRSALNALDQLVAARVTQAQMVAAVASLVGSSPAALDTLQELATALGNDPHFATTVLDAIATKANSSDVTAALSAKASQVALDALSGEAARKVSPTLSGAIGLNGSARGSKQALAAFDVNCALANYFTKAVAANSTFTFSNVPAAPARFTMVLEVTHTGGTIAWPAGVIWSGATAPSLTTGKVHLFFFLTSDGGTTWRASALVNFNS